MRFLFYDNGKYKVLNYLVEFFNNLYNTISSLHQSMSFPKCLHIFLDTYPFHSNIIYSLLIKAFTQHHTFTARNTNCKNRYTLNEFLYTHSNCLLNKHIFVSK